MKKNIVMEIYGWVVHKAHGLKLLCKFEKCKNFEIILQRGKKYLHNFYTFLHNFYTQFCTNFAPFLQLHILQNFLHLRPCQEAVSEFGPICHFSRIVGYSITSNTRSPSLVICAKRYTVWWGLLKFLPTAVHKYCPSGFGVISVVTKTI